jgi:hypothetical protein
MAEEKKEKWLNYLALSTVIFAVCATLSTFKGGGYGSKALLNQTKESNEWSYFQSKSIKSYIFENQRDNLELQKELIARSSNNKEDIAKYDAKIANYGKKLNQYAHEKDSISNVAKSYEAQIKECQDHSGNFGLAVIYLQVTILLSSIAGLLKKKPVWYLSLVIGAVGIVYFINGFKLFF